MNLQLRPALVSFIALSVLTGLAYPALTTGLSRIIFPKQAAGSLIQKNGQVIGSELIGQPFTAPGDFWSRPSATVDASGKPRPYNGANSGGSNLAPSNPALKEAVAGRIAAAAFQVHRVAKARGLEEARVRELVLNHTQRPQFAALGASRVNVLRLNLALEVLQPR